MKSFLFNLLLYLHNHWVSHFPSHWVRSLFLRWVMQIEMGEGVAVLLGLRLYTKNGIKIGAHSILDRDCVLDGRGGITIGRNVNLAPEVMLLTAYHDPDDLEDFGGVHKPIFIEDHVWLATRAMILPGVTIGQGAVVGAGSVVTKDVEPGMIVAGNPAKVIRPRRGIPTYELASYQRLLH